MLLNFTYTLHQSEGAAPAPSDTLSTPSLYFYREPGIYDTQQLGHPHAFIGYQYFPLIWTIKDKSFLHWNQRDNAPYNNESMMVVFDHKTQKLSDSYAWGEINPPNADVHLIAGIIGTADGRILMLEENPHIGPIHIKRSGANYNITNYTYHGSFGQQLAYPHLQRQPNGDLFCVFRESTIQDNGLNRESGSSIYKSTDNGLTWENLGYITFWPYLNSIREWAYPLMAYSGDGVIRLYINRRRGLEPVSFPTLYYMESEDGVTWRNISGTFSKNISGGNYITAAECDTHCLVLKYGDGGVNGTVIRANGAVTANGLPYCIGGHDDDPHSLRFIGWNGTGWFSKPIAVAGHSIYGSYVGTSADPNTTVPFNNNTVIIHKGGSTFDVYCMEDVGGYAHMSQFRTTNTGDTWTFVKQLTSGNFNYWNAQSTANHSEFGRGIVACVRRSANQTWGDIFVEEI